MNKFILGPQLTLRGLLVIVLAWTIAKLAPDLAPQAQAIAEQLAGGIFALGAVMASFGYARRLFGAPQLPPQASPRSELEALGLFGRSGQLLPEWVREIIRNIALEAVEREVSKRLGPPSAQASFAPNIAANAAN